MLQMLQDLSKKLGHTPLLKELSAEPGMPSGKLYRARFGSYFRAVAFAELEPTGRKYTTNELLCRYSSFAKELGRRPTGAEINANPNLPSANCYSSRFGGLNSVGNILGIPKRKNRSAPMRKYGDEELIDLLAQFGNRIGHAPTVTEVTANPDMPCVNTYAQRFSSYRKALELAGFDPADIGRHRKR